MARILVIDDEDLIRSMLRQALESLGHEVVEARHGEEAVQTYQKQPADLVITDIVMPKKEGLACIHELRQLDPGVRVIAISGGRQSATMDADRAVVWRLDLLDAAQHLGARRTFWKPFNLTEVLTAVREELEDRRPA